MTFNRVHIVGAGLAGLSSAVRLAAAGGRPALYEQSAEAGGRCRSFFDRKLGCLLDNGNHLLLSANRETLAYLDLLGGRQGRLREEAAVFPFVDLASRRSWRLDLERGRWSALAALCRESGATLARALGLLRFYRAGSRQVVSDLMPPEHPLYRSLIEPLTLAVMNGSPDEVSAGLFARVLRETLFKGARACRFLLPVEGLSPALVTPALDYLAARRCFPLFHRRLTGIEVEDRRVASLRLSGTQVRVEPGESVILALPPWGLAGLLPPQFDPHRKPVETRAIVNVHYRLPDRLAEAVTNPITGVLGGRVQWVFRRGPLASVTLGKAEAFLARDGEELAADLWPEVAAVLGIPQGMPPPCRVIKERRATPLQSPEAAAARRSIGTGLDNLFLAGDWCESRYPATIEAAVLSGRRAAEAVLGS